jgi:hypothetical protein
MNKIIWKKNETSKKKKILKIDFQFKSVFFLNFLTFANFSILNASLDHYCVLISNFMFLA